MKPRIFVSTTTTGFRTARTKSQATNSRRLLALAALILLLGIGGYFAWQSTRTQLTEFSQPKPTPTPKPLDKSRLREHLTTGSEKALALELAEAEHVQGHWTRKKRTDAAQAAHRQRLSGVSELAEELANLETGENASTTLSKMLRILEEQGIDSALAYLASQSARLLKKATASTETARQDLQPLLTGAKLALASGQFEKAETIFQKLLALDLPDWPHARYEYWVYLVDTKLPRQQSHQSSDAALATSREAERQARLLTRQEPNDWDWQEEIFSHNRIGDIASAQGDFSAAAKAYTDGMEIAQALAACDPEKNLWQFDLSVSHNKLGDLAVAQGDLPAAAKAYTAGLEIHQALAAREPENKWRQRDLFDSYYKLAGVAEKRGDAEQARLHYRKSHDILRAVADAGKYVSQKDTESLKMLKEKAGIE